MTEPLQKYIGSHNEREDMEMEGTSIYRGAGVATGLLIGFIICIILFRFINKDKNLSTKYDERQKTVRGKAYMYGFWGAMIAAILVMILDSAGIMIASRLTTDFFVIFIGTFIQVTYSIWNDGYYGINTNKKRFYIVSLCAGIANLLSVIANIKDGRFIDNGVISDAGINLLCVILFLMIAAELIIKDRMDEKVSAEESED
ncbi:MAG: hypothetical protein K6E98_13460 [Lachnospiraceae bacterium]|nr:hypothetical protein [Lachnospiraceae bacterium]